MKRNWKGGLFRIVIVSSIAVAIGYEIITTKELLKSYISWGSGFGIIFALKYIIIPAAIVYIIWWAINWCIKGFKETKLNINWEEGATRLVTFLCALLYTSLFCTAIGNLDHSLKQDCGIIPIYLKGVSDSSTSNLLTRFQRSTHHSHLQVLEHPDHPILQSL